MRSRIRARFGETADNLRRLAADEDALAAIERVAERCLEALRAGGKILFAGNGGSAADAQHLAAELVGRFAFDRPGVAALALSTDTSALTAIGNDYGYERVFARQVEAIGRRGDVLFGISTSGNSPNVLQAVETAHKNGLVTVGLTGREGGRLCACCDHCIRVPATATPRIQECHIAVGHVICELIEERLFG